jgi:PPP family 3-phenylpropionic acid transporter
MAVFYGAIFLVIGIQTPFWPVWLAGRGLGAPQIATVFAAAIWLKVFATPLIGAAADRLGYHRGVITALAALACVAYAGLAPADGFWPILSIYAVAATAQSAMMPLGDSITLAAVREEGVDYGRIRVWGSITFVLAAAGSGAVLATVRADGPSDPVLLLVLAASSLLLLACLSLPTPSGGPVGRSGGRARWTAVASLATDRRFWLFVAAVAAIQSSHQLYYGFGTLYWRSLGFSDAVIGGLWAEGVVAEIVLFWYGRRLIAWCGPIGLIGIGGAAAVVRWGFSGVLPELGAVVVLQVLHAFSFGAAHLGAMHYMARTVPPDAAASAQTLYAGVSAGIGSGVIMLAAGQLYATFGGRAYLFMALLSALGVLGVIALARRVATGGAGAIEWR